MSFETTVFDEIGCRTLVASVSTFQSIEDRDGMMESGAELGIREGHERLDTLLATRIGG